MVDFSNDPTARGFFSPERFESRVYDCEVTGEIPKSLNGAFVRVATEWLYPSRYPHDSIFNADGLVAMFRFKDGLVDFTERWVHTARWKNDLAARRQLYGLYRNPFTDDASIREETIDRPYLRTLANTNVLTHGGKLFAMKEDGPPYELDPETLTTRGPMTFDGKYRSQTFSAHPKIDPVSGEMICYGYEATGLATNAIFLYTVDRAGRVTSEVRFKAPYVSMIHDIAITQKHIVIPVFGFETSLERLKAGKIHWAWNAKLPTYFGILPRGGGAADLRWFKGPLREMVHTFNAHTEGDKVILEAPVGESNPFPFFPADPGNDDPPTVKRGWHVRRYTFDLGSRSDGFTEETLYSQPTGPFGRIDDRYISLDNRYVYAQFTDPARPFDEARAGNLRGRVTNCYARFDLHGQGVSTYFAGDTHSLGEPVFVPRHEGGPEGDGYLIGIASNLAEMRSELVIADATKLEAGDVARVILPFRLGSQVHGNWLIACCSRDEVNREMEMKSTSDVRERKWRHPPQEVLMSRRTFLGAAVAVAAAGAALSMPALVRNPVGSVPLEGLPEQFGGGLADAGAAPGITAQRAPIVTFHMDRPYLDPTGTAEPYHPPTGTRSGQVLAELGEEEFLSRRAFL